MIPLLFAFVAPSSAAEPAPADAPPAEAGTFSEKYRTGATGSKGPVRHGVRVGYVYAEGARQAGLSSNHLFGLGYEGEFRLLGSESVDFLLVPNVMFLGMNQGVVVPSGNLLVGAAFKDIVEVGTGVNVTLGTPDPLHMVVAVAVTPRMGELQLPIALSYIPDDSGDFRVGLTAGVNWGVR